MKLLHIDSSILSDNSVTRRLGRDVVEQWRQRYPAIEVTYRDLAVAAPAHLSAELFGARLIAAEQHSPAQRAEAALGEELLAEFLAADVIVLGAPMYNFTIPSTLKTYLDHIVRRGVTFRASETGIEGLIKDKKVYLAFSSAGFYTEDSPDQSYDFVVPLLKAVLGWLGITDITVVRANGLRNPELQATSLQKGIESIQIA